MSTAPFKLPAILEGQRVIVGCRYDTRMPWTVRLVFPTVPTIVRDVARAALRDGMDAPWGNPHPDGKEVYIAPAGDYVALYIVESTPHVDFDLEALFDKAPLVEALSLIYKMAPEGREADHRMDWDRGLRALDGAA